jgi:hypothetical protein
VALYRDGVPQATIVLGATASETEQLAAEELNAVLTRITGTPLPVTTDAAPPAGAGVLVGRSELTGPYLPQVSHDRLGRDGCLVLSQDNTLILLGANDWGTVWAVYEFLETLGWRYFFPTEVGEVIPSLGTITVGDLNIAHRPAVEYRWGAGNVRQHRCNYARGWQFAPVGHIYSRILAPSYFEEHPEWFALVAGRRTPDGQPCTTNPEVIDLFADYYREFWTKHPATNFSSICPNDTNGFCECENCRALDPPGMEWYQGAYVGPRIFAFCNAVADRLKEEFPDKCLCTYAYMNYTVPPDMPLADNLWVMICHSSGADYAHPMCSSDGHYTDPSFGDIVEAWAQKTDRLMLYEYYWKLAWGGSILPRHRSVFKDVPWLISQGVKGFYTQCWHEWDTNGLSYYCFNRLLWDAEADADEVLNDFYTKYYGPAAQVMGRYHGSFTDRLAAYPRPLNGDVRFTDAVFPVAFLDEQLALLHLAAEQAQGSPTYERRMERQRIACERTRQVSRLAAAFRHEDAGTALDAVSRIREMDQAYGSDGIFTPATETFLEGFIPTVVQSAEFTQDLASREQISPADLRIVSPETSAELWLYGHDWDPEEHIVCLKHRTGEWMRLGYVAPTGDDKGNGTDRVIVFPLAKRDDWLIDGKVYLELYNPAGGYERSALNIFALMPPTGSTSDSATAALVGNDAAAVETLLRQSIACKFITLDPGADWWSSLCNEDGQVTQLVLAPFDRAEFDERIRNGDIVLPEDP